MIRLTVFADHDLKHSLAGGANVNLQENLKRLSGKMKIRLLCSLEPGLKEREILDGVEILRFRGNPFTLRLKIPRYFKRNLEDQTDIVWDEVDSSVPWFTPLYTRKPVLLHCLHFQKSTFFYELPKWKAALAYAFEPRLYGLYRRGTALTISGSTRDSLMEIGFPEERIRVVPPGLDPAVFEEEAELKRKKSKIPTVVALSRLRAWKGVHWAIEAMKEVVRKMPEAKLQIIGTGPYEGALKNLVKRLDLGGQVRFLGKLAEQEKLECLKNAHVLTKTSGREGWGIDVLEANACLTPAVGWDVPGARDSIQNRKTGILVPFGDTAGLAEEVFKLLKNHDLRSRMAHEADLYSRQFTWDRSSREIEKLLGQMV
jgi:glycosyltransferase involved in cell wall biosynthesis